MSDVLAAYLLAFRRETTYAQEEDWIFASVRTKGATPRVGNMLVRDYLYPAAVRAGVLTEVKKNDTWPNRKTGKTLTGERTVYFDRNGERVKRFGFHQFRHSLSIFLTTKKKVDPKRRKPPFARATRPSRSTSTRKRIPTSFWRRNR
jgi:hypothetical protein